MLIFEVKKVKLKSKGFSKILLYKKFILSYRSMLKTQQFLVFNSTVFLLYFKFSFLIFYSFSKLINYFKKFFVSFFEVERNFVFKMFFLFHKKLSLRLKRQKIKLLLSFSFLKSCVFNFIFYRKVFLLYLKLNIIIFHILYYLFSLKKDVVDGIQYTDISHLFSIYKKNKSMFNMNWQTFLVLVDKLFIIWKLKIALYKKTFINLLNCYIVFSHHNIFITVSSSVNEPILVCSSGKVGFGQRTKHKISTQAATKIALFVVKQLQKKKQNNDLCVFICTNKLFDKRIKTILSVFQSQGLRIKALVPQLIRDVGGVRPKKIRRV